MSTISDALDKKRVERDGGDAEAILERNAAYREQMRRRPGGRRLFYILAAVCLMSAVACLLALMAMMVGPPGESDGTTKERSGLRPTPDANAAAVRPAESAGRPKVRESVRLRTRPLLRSASRIYAVGPQPQPITTTPPPVATPEPVKTTQAPVATPSTELSGVTKPANPVPTKTDPREFLSLTGIVRDPKKPQALINGRIVEIGDSIEGCKVLAIVGASHVTVEFRGKKYNIVPK